MSRRHLGDATQAPVRVDDEGQTMTGWEVERMPRAAVPVPSGAPTGVSPLMPPHSQGAERRTERRAGRTGSRWGLRVLVIGGLAGTAWLLTGAAAHAADRDPVSGGPALGAGLIGSVVPGDSAPTTVVRVLQTATRPLDSGRPQHRHEGSASLAEVPARLLSGPAGTLTSTLSEATPARTAGTGGIDRVVRELTGPLRLTGGPVESPLTPVTARLTRTLRPVTGLLPHAAMPAMTAQRPIAAPAAIRTTAASSGLTDTGRAPRVLAAGLPAGMPDAVVPAARSARYLVMPDVAAPGRVVQPHSVTRVAAEPETARETTPGSDGPAPLQVHFGALSGLSTTGSGAPTEGGSAAFLPAAVAASTMAFHRLPIATGVVARRYDAEAPTVSPD